MKVWDVVRNAHPWDGNTIDGIDLKDAAAGCAAGLLPPGSAGTCILSGDMQICSIEEAFLKAAPPVITVFNEKENLIGETRKEDLEFFAEPRVSWFGDAVMDSLEIGIIAANENGRIFYVNHAYEELLGVPVNKVVGRNILKIEPESDLSKAIRTRKNIVNPQKQIKSVNRYVSLRIQTLMHNGEFHGAVSLFTDVTTLETLSTEIERMSGMMDELRQQLEDNYHKTGLVTRDQHFLQLLEQAAVAARTNVPVLIRGENGVGKEVVARYIHRSSDRSDRPMVMVNCSSIPESLIESELFGYEEGSFTGAQKGGKMGKFELANHGTIFLDEIGDMPVAMQSRLLRVIENGEIEKIGRQKNIPVDVRIIAATNQPLEKLIREKTFRMDLFFRLNVISLSIPALRDRKEDIPLLADHFLNEFTAKYGRQRIISEKGYRRLSAHAWRGNVRELRNCIERAVILSEGKTLDFKEIDALAEAPKDSSPAQHTDQAAAGVLSGMAPGQSAGALSGLTPEQAAEALSDRIPGQAGSALPEQTLEEAVAACEESLIRRTLAETGGDRAEAIRRLGLSRRTFYRKCALYGILDS